MLQRLGLILLLVGVALCQIDIQILANWEKPPFELSLLETVATENSSYYVPALAKVAGLSISEEDEPFIWDTDEELYEAVFGLLTPTEYSLYQIPLANKYHSPRVIAHYQYYNEVARPEFEAKLSKKCGSTPKTWLQFKNVVYCDPDDIYALMTDSTPEGDVLPFDRVIGDAGPLLVLYGDVKDESFRKFLSNLFDAASAGKLRFVWRYVPQYVEEREILSGYGVDLTLKRTDYIVIDDRDVKSDHIVTERSNSSSNSLTDIYDEDIKAVSKDDINQLGLQVASYALSFENSTEQLSALLSVMEELPKFSSYLVDQVVNDELLPNIALNKKLGISSANPGIFVNGKLLEDTKQNIFGLYHEIKSELSIIERFKDLKFKPLRARNIMEKFALMTVYKSRSKSAARYGISSGGTDPVIYLNDVETDPIYENFSEDVSDYIGRFDFGQIPDVKSNIHRVVFAIDLSNKEHLAMVKNVATAILNNAIPQRVGIIPLPLTEEGAMLANVFYFIAETKGTTMVKDFIARLNQGNRSFEDPPEFDYVSFFVEPFMEKFDVDSPVLVVNGIFHELDSNWAYSLTRQITQDVNFIVGIAYQKLANTFADVQKLVYEDELPFRSRLLFPANTADIRYKAVSVSDIDAMKSLSPNVYEFVNEKEGENVVTLTLGGDFGSRTTLLQLHDVLVAALEVDANMKVRLIHTTEGVSFLGKIKQSLHNSVDHAINVVNSILAENQFVEDSASDSNSVKAVLTSIGLPSPSFLMINGRHVDLGGSHVSSPLLKFFVDQEIEQRLSLIRSLLGKDKAPDKVDIHDWFEVASSTVSTTFYAGDGPYSSGTLPRVDLSRANRDLAISFGNQSQSDLHIMVTIDPTEESSQRLLSLADAVKDLDFISMDILLVPKEEMDEIPIKRFYKANFKSAVSFEEGSAHEEQFVSFENIPAKTLFTLDMDVPPSWIVMPKECPSDLDNVLLSQSGPVQGIYELECIIIEGNAVDITTGDPPTGLAVKVPGSDTNVMTNHGYLQLKANPGLCDFSIKEGRSSDLYNLLSVDSFDSKDMEVKNGGIQLALLNLDGLQIYPRIAKKAEKEHESLIISDEAEVAVSGSVESKGIFSSWFNTEKKSKQADINIFSVASGHLYERLLSIMTVSVMRHTDHTVKFWLIDNYMSPTFRRFLPHLSKKYGFEYELITYKWPSWLRGQREKQRTIWGYKILFLDVLFPQDLDKVIFVDADQIVRTDMYELVEMDLQGAPYGYTPMGNSREEMEGFRFWKQGYWKTFLADRFQYHISALYVIDLKKFRSIAAGDKLRQHYQALSRDPESLSNLDQDLPNNLQPQLKIFSLPQEWLWCETWCDDESLKTAKTIDLCNNPLTKEPKLDRARRQIPEWTVYDDEIAALNAEVFSQDQNVVAESSVSGADDGSGSSHSITEDDHVAEHDEL